MAHDRVVALLLVALADELRDGHRAVTAAGAAHADGEVRFALRGVAREEEVEQREQALEVLAGARRLHDEVAHLGVEARERPQAQVVVRVGQEAHVEEQVGVDGDAVLVAERHHGEHDVGAPRVVDEVLVEARLELVDRGVAGVDHQVGALAQAGEQPPLLADAVDDAAAGGQRVPATGLLETPDKSLVGRLEEDERVLDAALVQLVEQVFELAEVLAAAHVADDGHAVDLAARAAKEVDERRHELRREVVDAEPAGVFERVHGLRLAGPRQARDDDELQRLGHASLPSTTGTPSSFSRRSFQAGSSPYCPSRPSFLTTR